MDPQQNSKQNKEIGVLEINEEKLLYIKNPADPYTQDIVPGVYQGGLKIWECTIDLLKFIIESSPKFEDQQILQIGCGHGILGMGCLKKGGKTCLFQDFNKDVIENATIPNLGLNNFEEEKCFFKYGDWDEMDFEGRKFDLIVGSQIIYRQENYLKIINVCKRALRPTGKCLLANKHYYFGVGGNMPAFKQLVEKEGLKWQSLQKINPPKGGNKKQIIEIALPSNWTA